MTKGDTGRVQHGYRFTLTISEPFNLKRQSKRIDDIELTLSIYIYIIEISRQPCNSV